MTTEKESVILDMETVVCCQCSIAFRFPSWPWRRTGNWFYCPSGHVQRWTTPEQKAEEEEAKKRAAVKANILNSVVVEEEKKPEEEKHGKILKFLLRPIFQRKEV